MHFFTVFCKQHPALIHSLFFLMGLGFIKDFNLSFLIPFCALLIPLGWKKPLKGLPFLALFLIACFYGNITKETFPASQNCVQGRALFVPLEIKTHRSHFKKMDLLKGTIKSMESSQEKSIKNIPCSIALSSTLKRPFINSSFYIQGSLEKKGDLNPFFSFKPDSSISWIPVPYSFSFTELRFQIKETLAQKIGLLFSNSKVADLMVALSLGNLDDRMLKFDFARLGLQHVLTISGFHFGLLACILGLFFRSVLQEKFAYIALLISLTLYFLLLGSSPSILRAYLACSLYLLSKLNKWHSSGLNILGAALFLEILIDPKVISHLGFQLSFLATFSILFFLPLTRRLTLAFFPYRTEEQTLQLSFLERWGYLFCCFLRSAFALNIAVSLTTIPVCLFYFHKFPIMSLGYNLFIPLFFSLSLFVFFISIPFFLILPPFAQILTYCNERFTEMTLKFTSQSPLYFDISLYTPKFPLPILLIFLIGVFCIPFIARFLPCDEKGKSR